MKSKSPETHVIDSWQHIEDWQRRVIAERQRVIHGEGFDRVLVSNLLFEIAMQLSAIRETLCQIADRQG